MAIVEGLSPAPHHHEHKPLHFVHPWPALAETIASGLVRDPRAYRSLLIDMQQAGMELLQLHASHTFKGEDVPRGDGQPVIVAPGLLGGDFEYADLRNWLYRMGHEPHASGISFNTGQLRHHIHELEDTVKRVTDRAQRSAIIVGHSLGGVYAKYVAGKLPDRVDTVVTLGSPLVKPKDPARMLVHRLADNWVAKSVENARLLEEMQQPFPPNHRFVSISGSRDHIVNPQATHDPYAQRIEVTGSHIGLAFNRHVYRRLGEILAASL